MWAVAFDAVSSHVLTIPAQVLADDPAAEHQEILASCGDGSSSR